MHIVKEPTAFPVLKMPSAKCNRRTQPLDQEILLFLRITSCIRLTDVQEQLVNMSEVVLGIHFEDIDSCFWIFLRIRRGFERSWAETRRPDANAKLVEIINDVDNLSVSQGAGRLGALLHFLLVFIFQPV